MPAPGKNIFFSALVIFISITGITQSGNEDIPAQRFLFYLGKVDSLPSLEKAGKMKISILCNVSDHDKYIFENNSLSFSSIALRFNKSSEQLRNSYCNIYVMIELANHFFNEKKYDVAFTYWQRALDTSRLRGFYGEELHDIRIAINNTFFLLGDYTGAMKNSTEGLAISEKIGDKNRIAHFSNVIGYIHMKLRNFPEAKNYFTNYLEQSRSIYDTLLEAHALYNLGDLVLAENNFDKAINYFTQSINTYRSIKDPEYLSFNEREGFVSNKLAQCWKLKGELAKALNLINISLKTTNAILGVNAYDKADYFITAGDIYNRRGIPDSGIYYTTKGLAIASAINHRELKRDAFEQLAISFADKKMFDSAFIYQQLFSNLKDSIVNEISQQDIFQREINRQVERQKQLQKIAVQKQKATRNIIIGISVLLISLLVFLYNRYQLKQKNRYQKELNRQQNELFNAVSVAQEQERKRIAQDIHDGLGSLLSAAKLKMAEVKDGQPGLEVDDKFLTGIGLLDEAATELRLISHNIMPATLSKLGLSAALNNLIEKISSEEGLQVQFISHGFDNRLEEQQELSIYRIVLELTNNIVKHSKASKASVQLIKYSDYINITVEDNGMGFEYEKIKDDRSGLGLGSVAARVEYLNGVLEFDSQPGRGTTIVINVPVKTGE